MSAIALESDQQRGVSSLSPPLLQCFAESSDVSFERLAPEGSGWPQSLARALQLLLIILLSCCTIMLAQPP